MGCDIHAYIETVTIHTGRGGEEITNVHSWAKVKISRDYWLFSLLARVRGGTLTDDIGFAPKGIPEKLGWDAEEDYYYLVDDKRADEDEDGTRYISTETAEKYRSYGSTYVPSYTREDGYTHPAKVSGPDWHTPSWLGVGELQELVKRWRALPKIVPARDFCSVKIEPGLTEEDLRTRLAGRKPRKGLQIALLEIRGDYAHYVSQTQEKRRPPAKDLLACLAAMKALQGVERYGKQVAKTIPRLTFWFDN